MGKPTVRNMLKKSQYNFKPAQIKRGDVPMKIPKNIPAIDEMMGCLLLSAEHTQAVTMPTTKKYWPYVIIMDMSP